LRTHKFLGVCLVFFLIQNQFKASVEAHPQDFQHTGVLFLLHLHFFCRQAIFDSIEDLPGGLLNNFDKIVERLVGALRTVKDSLDHGD